MNYHAPRPSRVPCGDDDSRKEQSRLTALGRELDAKYVDSKRIIGLMRWAASERMLQSHRLSDLVIRKGSDGKYILACFIYFYSSLQINTGRMPRPQAWLELDFVSGQPKAKYICEDREFSDAPYDTVYDFNTGEEYDTSPEYYRFAYNILDEVRIGILKTGSLDIKLYKKYLKAIMSNTPGCYRRFFDDLSDPLGKKPL